MLLLHWLSRWQHSFSCAPRMDFSIEQTSFDDWIVWSELGSLLCSHPENGDAPQLALIARHSFNESVMLLHHIHELRRVWVPSLLLSKPRGRDARRVEWNFAEIHGILPNSGSSIAIIRRACDESSYRLHECSGSARGMYQLEHYIHNSGLEESLVHLVKMRAAQINGCAYCLDMHSKDARALGETEQELYVLDAWEEAPLYSERERPALALPTPSPGSRTATCPTRSSSAHERNSTNRN